MTAARPLLARLAARPPARIVVVQTAYLGDTVFTSALVGGLRARWPQARLDLCVAPRGRDVAEAISGVSSVLVFDKAGKDRGVGGLWRTARRLREEAHDLAVLPHRSLRSGLLAWLARIPERLGFSGTAAGLFCTERAPDYGGTFLEREAGLLAAIGARPAPMRLSPPAAQRALADRALEGLRLHERPFAALCPGSEWATKIWPAARYGELADALALRGMATLVLGSPREQALADAIRAAAHVPVASVVGNTVGESLAILERAALVVGGDSGLVHAARALGTPAVVLFGPTAPEAHIFGPRERLVSLRLDCAPCSSHGSRECPLGHHRCMRELAVDRALRACAELLDAR